MYYRRNTELYANSHTVMQSLGFEPHHTTVYSLHYVMAYSSYYRPIFLQWKAYNPLILGAETPLIIHLPSKKLSTLFCISHSLH